MEDYKEFKNGNVVEYVKVITQMLNLLTTGNADLAFQLMHALEFNEEDVERLFKELFVFAFSKLPSTELIINDAIMDDDCRSIEEFKCNDYLTLHFDLIHLSEPREFFMEKIVLEIQNKYAIKFDDNYDIEITPNESIGRNDFDVDTWTTTLNVLIEDHVIHSYFHNGILRFIHHYNQLTNG